MRDLVAGSQARAGYLMGSTASSEVRGSSCVSQQGGTKANSPRPSWENRASRKMPTAASGQGVCWSVLPIQALPIPDVSLGGREPQCRTALDLEWTDFDPESLE